jgi:hypothetical protein
LNFHNLQDVFGKDRKQTGAAPKAPMAPTNQQAKASFITVDYLIFSTLFRPALSIRTIKLSLLWART